MASCSFRRQLAENAEKAAQVIDKWAQDVTHQTFQPPSWAPPGSQIEYEVTLSTGAENGAPAPLPPARPSRPRAARGEGARRRAGSKTNANIFLVLYGDGIDSGVRALVSRDGLSRAGVANGQVFNQGPCCPSALLFAVMIWISYVRKG